METNMEDSTFCILFSDKRLQLPIRWDGVDFNTTLKELLFHYTETVEIMQRDVVNEVQGVCLDAARIKRICNLLLESMRSYLNGFPSGAYESFRKVMDELDNTPLKTYEKSAYDVFDDSYNDSLKLFRVVSVDNDRLPKRERVFHAPYTLRSKVATCRYSIAGYPSLYLATSLEQCCAETHLNLQKGNAIAALFRLNRAIRETDLPIKVIELSVKPQDFLESNRNDNHAKRRISSSLLASPELRSAYLLWYPLIAACSYIRAQKNDPFAPEYVIPQLLMQWARSKIDSNEGQQLVGIRFFSCTSVKASEMGINYVFPTSGQKDNLPFCPVLEKALPLTKPVFIHEYESYNKCEEALCSHPDFSTVENI